MVKQLVYRDVVSKTTRTAQLAREGAALDLREHIMHGSMNCPGGDNQLEVHSCAHYGGKRGTLK